MNPLLTTNVLNSGNGIENNALSLSDGLPDAQSDEVFTGKFSEVLGDLLSADGKLKPLDLAALKELGVEQLSELQELVNPELSSQTLDLKQLSALKSLLSPELNKQIEPELESKIEDIDLIENVDLFGNPEVNGLLKSTLTENTLLEAGLTNNKPINKAELLSGKVITSDVLQQSMLKKEPDLDLSNAFDDINFSKYMNDLAGSDIDFGSEFLAQTGRKEANTLKLVDQLSTSIDKPINVTSPMNNHSLKPYSGLEQSGAAMNRIEVPVNQPGWSEAMGNRLMMMVDGKVQSANIHLHPAELGPIEIRVSVNHEHASVHFVSNNALVRDAIEDAMPRLKDMFSQNGLSLADANVSQQSQQQSSQQDSQFLNDQSESMMTFNNESSETTNIQTQSNNDSMIDIGLVNQYV